jgi:hypothetical protein
MKRSGSANITTGAIGTYLVAAELVRQGFIVSALSQTAKGIDILAADPQMLRPLAIQVKTTKRKGRTWLLHQKSEAYTTPGLFYCFVTMPPGSVPEFFVVPAAVVAQVAREIHRTFLSRPLSRKGRPPRDSAMRLFRDRDGKWLNRWDVLKVDQR